MYACNLCTCVLSVCKHMHIPSKEIILSHSPLLWEDFHHEYVILGKNVLPYLWYWDDLQLIMIYCDCIWFFFSHIFPCNWRDIFLTHVSVAWPCPVDMSIIISNSLHLYLESINYSFCNVLYSTMSHYSCLINSGSHTITSRFFMQTIWFCEY